MPFIHDPVIAYLSCWLELRLDGRRDERGDATQTVILTAVFAALALAVGGIIVYKVITKANGIPVDATTPTSLP